MRATSGRPVGRRHDAGQGRLASASGSGVNHSPLTARVTMPYLIDGLSGSDSRHLRWAYQFTIGQSYRLPPAERRRWQQALEAKWGPGAAPIELLRCAQDDAPARRMLRDAQQD